MVRMICQEPGCEEPALSHGWCRPHGNEPIDDTPYDPVFEGFCSRPGCDRPLRAGTATANTCLGHYFKERAADIACTVCGRPSKARGLCSTHYTRWQRHGDAEAKVAPRKPRPKPKPGTRRCTVDNCRKAHQARGFCGMHYYRWRKYGDPLIVSPPHTRSRTLCRICGEPSVGYELCTGHITRLRRWGDPMADIPIKRPELKLCIELGCDRRSRTRDRCAAHYMRWYTNTLTELCRYPECTFPARQRGYCGRHYTKLKRAGLLKPLPPRICMADECEERHWARGWCRYHYDVWRKDTVRQLRKEVPSQ